MIFLGAIFYDIYWPLGYLLLVCMRTHDETCDFWTQSTLGQNLVISGPDRATMALDIAR